MSTFPIQIDATALFMRRFYIPGISGADGFDSRQVQTVALEPNTYSFQISAGEYCPFKFAVTDDGKVSYAPEHNTFLGGLRTQKLELKGYEVLLDARYLPGAGLLWWGNMVTTSEDWFTYKHCRLLPAEYGVQQGSALIADAKFRLDLQGHFQYDGDLDKNQGGVLQGMGTSTLAFYGFPLLVDARNAGGIGVTVEPVILDVPFSATGVEFVNLLPTQPGQGYQLQFRSGVVSKAGFNLSRSGKVELVQSAPYILSLDTFHGLCRLTVNTVVLTATGVNNA